MSVRLQQLVDTMTACGVRPTSETFQILSKANIPGTNYHSPSDDDSESEGDDSDEDRVLGGDRYQNNSRDARGFPRGKDAVQRVLVQNMPGRGLDPRVLGLPERPNSGGGSGSGGGGVADPSLPLQKNAPPHPQMAEDKVETAPPVASKPTVKVVKRSPAGAKPANPVARSRPVSVFSIGAVDVAPTAPKVVVSPFSEEELKGMKVLELREHMKALGLRPGSMVKAGIINAILEHKGKN